MLEVEGQYELLHLTRQEEIAKSLMWGQLDGMFYEMKNSAGDLHLMFEEKPEHGVMHQK